VGPALRAHAHPPRQPGEPGRLARPLAQPSAPCHTHTHNQRFGSSILG
jgi:hypothetical protein